MEGERCVSRSEAENVASHLWGCTYFEVSAKTRVNVVESFETLLKEIVRISKSASENEVKRKKGGCILL
uniref:Uncharacterized protein n=1 Tax=Arcella intermedia TaxID=1963864 RepID=A0A6B2LVS1_9EUKA